MHYKVDGGWTPGSASYFLQVSQYVTLFSFIKVDDMILIKLLRKRFSKLKVCTTQISNLILDKNISVAQKGPENTALIYPLPMNRLTTWTWFSSIMEYWTSASSRSESRVWMILFLAITAASNVVHKN